MDGGVSHHITIRLLWNSEALFLNGSAAIFYEREKIRIQVSKLNI
jgi:hypothetical protein